MLSVEDTTRRLEEAGLELVGKIVIDALLPSTYYVFINVELDAHGRQTPSTSKLKTIAEDFNSEETDLRFILMNRTKTNIEATINGALDRRFSTVVKNAFVADAETGITIWIEPRIPLSSHIESEIRSVVAEISSVLRIPSKEIYFTTTAHVPTPTACLGAIRIGAPINADTLRTQLINRGFQLPDGVWLMRMIDRLRKSGWILRLKGSDKYVLTIKGLRDLGSSKTSESPDVVRALALARRSE